MNLASLQTITWSTVTAAVGSALLLASVGAELRPMDARSYRASPPLRAERRVPAAAPLATAAGRPAIIRTSVDATSQR